jgi:Cys-tRNA(Pro) deacylase
MNDEVSEKTDNEVNERMDDEVSERILKKLDDGGIDYKLFEHDYIHTSEDASNVRSCGLSECTKCLVFKTKEGNFILVITPGNKRADTKKIAKLERTKRIFLASPEEVDGMSGCKVGSVGPFGHKTKLKTYMDSDVLKNESCFFSIGLHTKSIEMRTRDLEKLVNAVLF